MAKQYMLSDNGAIQNHIMVSDDELAVSDIMPADRVQALIHENTATRNADHAKNSTEGVIHARVPIPLWHEWKRDWQANYKDYVNWQEYLVKKINNRDFSLLRTTEGKIHLPDNIRTRG